MNVARLPRFSNSISSIINWLVCQKERRTVQCEFPTLVYGRSWILCLDGMMHPTKGLAESSRRGPDKSNSYQPARQVVVLNRLIELPLLHRSRWIAGDNCPRFHIFHRDRSRSDNGAFPDGHSRANKGVGTYPSLVSNYDGRFEQWQIQLLVVVRAGAKLGPMGNRDLLPERYGAKIVDERVLSDRAPIAHRKVPGKIDPGGGIGVDMRSNLGAEAPQHKPAPTKTGPRA